MLVTPPWEESVSAEFPPCANSTAASRGTFLTVGAPLHPKLGERTEQCGLDGCELFPGKIPLANLTFRTGDCLRCGILIDFFLLEGHVGQDRNPIGSNLKESLAYCESKLSLFRRNTQLSWMNFRQEGNVLGKDT